MDRIKSLCYKLKVGAKLILVDKQPFEHGAATVPPEDCPGAAASECYGGFVFQQIGSCQVRTSWGAADIFVYQKTGLPR